MALSTFLRSARSVLSLKRHRNVSSWAATESSTPPRTSTHPPAHSSDTMSSLNRRHTHAPTSSALKSSTSSVDRTAAVHPAPVRKAVRNYSLGGRTGNAAVLARGGEQGAGGSAVTVANVTARLAALNALDPTDPSKMRLPKSRPIDRTVPFDSPLDSLRTTPSEAVHTNSTKANPRTPPTMFPIERSDSSESVGSVMSTQWCSVDYNLVQNTWKTSKLAVVNGISPASSIAPSPLAPRRGLPQPDLRTEEVPYMDFLAGFADVPDITISSPDGLLEPRSADGTGNRAPSPSATSDRAEKPGPLRQPSAELPPPVHRRAFHETAPSAEFHFPPPPSSPPPPAALLAAAASSLGSLPDCPPPPAPPRKDSVHYSTRPGSTIEEYKHFEASHRKEVEATRTERRKSLSPSYYIDTTRKLDRGLSSPVSMSALSPHSAASVSKSSPSRIATFLKHAIRGRRKSLPTNRPIHRHLYATRPGAARSALSLRHSKSPLPEYLMQYAEHGAPAANVDFDPIKVAGEQFKQTARSRAPQI
ncbi:hypothetical protein HDU86_003936 [Geranomyces michiganensis]|nr:hypothetical protein HDU86_003936 [Geranomyces michiganensis]